MAAVFIPETGKAEMVPEEESAVPSLILLSKYCERFFIRVPSIIPTLHYAWVIQFPNMVYSVSCLRMFVSIRTK